MSAIVVPSRFDVSNQGNGDHGTAPVFGAEVSFDDLGRFADGTDGEGVGVVKLPVLRGPLGVESDLRIVGERVYEPLKLLGRVVEVANVNALV